MPVGVDAKWTPFRRTRRCGIHRAERVEAGGLGCRKITGEKFADDGFVEGRRVDKDQTAIDPHRRTFVAAEMKVGGPASSRGTNELTNANGSETHRASAHDTTRTISSYEVTPSSIFARASSRIER